MHSASLPCFVNPNSQLVLLQAAYQSGSSHFALDVRPCDAASRRDHLLRRSFSLPLSSLRTLVSPSTFQSNCNHRRALSRCYNTIRCPHHFANILLSPSCQVQKWIMKLPGRLLKRNGTIYTKRAPQNASGTSVERTGHGVRRWTWAVQSASCWLNGQGAAHITTACRGVLARREQRTLISLMLAQSQVALWYC